MGDLRILIKQSGKKNKRRFIKNTEWRGGTMDRRFNGLCKHDRAVKRVEKYKVRRQKDRAKKGLQEYLRMNEIR